MDQTERKKVMKDMEETIDKLVFDLKPAEQVPEPNSLKEPITFDKTVQDNHLWKQLICEKLKTAESFEIHCWKDELDEMMLALVYGEIKPSDWKGGTIIEGEVTPEFIKMILEQPKPKDTEIYNKMTPFFTINLDNRFSSSHYGTEIYQ